MATNFTFQDIVLDSDVIGYKVVNWQLGQDEAGDPYSGSNLTDRTVQIDGTFGGATVVIEGTVDGVTWFTLSDVQGSSISTTSNTLVAITEMTTSIRPRVTGGNGTTDIKISLACRGSK